MAGFLQDVADQRRQLLVRTGEMSELWGRAQQLSGAAGATRGLVGADLARMRGELERRDFTIGVFGMIKRGKSTLLNALLGSELSPMHVTPETAVPVHIEHGDVPRATVHLTTGERRTVPPEDVATWTSQKHNPRNERGVIHVRWSYPSPLLREGVRLVDTPGLDDAEADELYTRRTVQELDTVDAGIVVFMSPPTVGATEMAFLRDVTAAHLRKVVLVANLYPQHFHDDDTRRQVVEYVRARVAEHTGVDDVRIHPICAEEAWGARRDGDETAWRASGGADVLAAVEATIAEHTGAAVVARAQATLDRIGQVAAAAIDLRVRVLTDGMDRDQQDFLRDQQRQMAAPADDRLVRGLEDLEGTRAQMHALVHQAFLRARSRIAEAESSRDLDQVLRRFAREVEVVTEDAFRKVRTRLVALHDEIAADFEAGVAATLHDLGAVQPGTGLLDGPQAPAIPSATAGRRDTVGAAAMGGLVAGGAGFALVGTLLGPIGLVAGALVGWRLGGLVGSGRSLRALREVCDERLDEVAQALLEEFDRRIDDLATVVRQSGRSRRDGFAEDMTDMLRLLDELADPVERREVADRLREVHRRLELLATGATVIELDPARQTVVS